MTRELLAPWVALAFVAPRAIVVCRAPRVTLASRDPRATRVTSASVDLQAQAAFQAHRVHRVLQVSVALSALSDAVV